MGLETTLGGARVRFRRPLTTISLFASTLSRTGWVGAPKLTLFPGAGNHRYATAHMAWSQKFRLTSEATGKRELWPAGLLNSSHFGWCNMFDSQRVGERPYGPCSQPALLLAQIYFNWRRFTSRKNPSVHSIQVCIDSRSLTFWTNRLCNNLMLSWGQQPMFTWRLWLVNRPATREAAGVLLPPQKLSSSLEKSVGHSWKLLDIGWKIWAPLRKLFATPGVPSWLRAYL